jgi:hypothetical protein
MKNLSKLEIITAIALFIGILSWLSQKFFYIEALKNPYGLGDFLLVAGVLLWCRILWKKGKEDKENTK